MSFMRALWPKCKGVFTGDNTNLTKFDNFADYLLWSAYAKITIISKVTIFNKYESRDLYTCSIFDKALYLILYQSLHCPWCIYKHSKLHRDILLHVGKGLYHLFIQLFELQVMYVTINYYWTKCKPGTRSIRTTLVENNILIRKIDSKCMIRSGC